MVESERSHRRGSRKSEFFFCFSSRSSSSMKISSKSILSPGRTREPMSLSSSLSRRLRSNGSMKGGQASPMFPTGSKKKGGSFEPPEPSSPKVTCIGQVRVKSKKKHGRKLRTRSQRRGEVSFRKTEQPQDGIHHQQQGPQECLPHRNQRWVHLPLSICETLRAFGAEFNCFAPCGSRNSSCSWSNGREKVEKRRGGSTSCGAVFARWLFALQESEEKGRENEPVVREEEKREYRENREVVREIEMEVLEEELETKGEEIEEVEEPRESICIPPKNALLLMRSRSAPFRMSSLVNRFWESPAPQESNAEELEIGDIKEEEDMENEDWGDAEREELDVEQALAEDKEVRLDLEEGNREEEMLENLGSVEIFEDEEIKETQIKEGLETPENVEQQQEDLGERNAEVMDSGFSLGSLEEKEGEEVKLQVEEKEEVKEIVEKKEERRVSFSSSTMYLEPEEESDLEEEAEQALEERVEDISPRSRTEQQINVEENEEDDQEEEEEEEEEEEKSLLPECLLLMMCEPKLSMEVSKETWVCSTDFVRIRHPEKKLNQKNGGDESTKKRLSTDSNHVKPTHPVQQKPMQQQKKKQEKHVQVEIQPPRSSCSKVIATVIEQKLTNAAGAHEPFVLKRSKSEPMRNSAKLAPEVCFWNKNKLEPHRPPSLGVGATGIGF